MDIVFLFGAGASASSGACSPEASPLENPGQATKWFSLAFLPSNLRSISSLRYCIDKHLNI